MKDMGFDTVCLSFSESEMQYARRTFEIQVNLAHRAGLKVFVVPSRIGGRFAGAPLMPSVWLARNPQFAVQDKWMPVACLESDEVREWFKSFMKTLLTDYDLDGIVWDEPKGIGVISHHPATIEKIGPNPTKEDMMLGFVDFFEDLTGYCKDLKPTIIQTLFSQKQCSEFFTQNISKTSYIEYFGYDGNLCAQQYFKEEIKNVKYRIESVWDRTVKECAAADKKTFALVENMLMPKQEIPVFKENFENYLQNYRPDHLSVYYYAHNVEDPEALHKVIKEIMKKYL
ncbi:MAG: hypothetical protein BWY15_00960 [Firmicutes bacterium ADurb.Bin193]|nr:MAG: hypothetical protein BWY15_00960 [Firmicutes bacterium ADurb.Bin193]